MKLRRELTIKATADHPDLGPLLFTGIRPEVTRIDVLTSRLDGSPFEDGMTPPHVRFALVPGSPDSGPWTAETVLWGGQPREIEQELAMQRLHFFVDCIGGELVRPNGEKPSEQFDKWKLHRSEAKQLSFNVVEVVTDHAVLLKQQRWKEIEWAEKVLSSRVREESDYQKALQIVAQLTKRDT